MERILNMFKNSKVLSLSIILVAIFLAGFGFFINNSFAMRIDITGVNVDECSTKADVDAGVLAGGNTSALYGDAFCNRNGDVGYTCQPRGNRSNIGADPDGVQICQFPPYVPSTTVNTNVFTNPSNITKETPDKPGVLRVNTVTKEESFKSKSGDYCVTNTSPKGSNYFIPNKTQQESDSFFKNAAISPEFQKTNPGISVSQGHWGDWVPAGGCVSRGGYKTCGSFPDGSVGSQVFKRTWLACGSDLNPPANDSQYAKAEPGCNVPACTSQSSLSNAPFQVTDPSVSYNEDPSMIPIGNAAQASIFGALHGQQVTYVDFNVLPASLFANVSIPTISTDNSAIPYKATVKIGGDDIRGISILKGDTVCGIISSGGGNSKTGDLSGCESATGAITCRPSVIKVGFSASVCGRKLVCDTSSKCIVYSPTGHCEARTDVISCGYVPNLCAFDNYIDQCTVYTYSKPH